MTLAAIRERLAACLSALASEHHAAASGRRDKPRFSAIFDRYADLARREPFDLVSEHLSAATDVDDERRLRHLREGLAVHGEEFRLHALEQQLAALRASYRVQVEGEPVAYRDLEARLHASTDRGQRRAIQRAINAALAGPFRSLHVERARSAQAMAREHGSASYSDFWREMSGIDLAALARQFDLFSARTSARMVSLVTNALPAAAGIPIGEAESHDAIPLLRGARFDHAFPRGGALALARSIVEGGLGLDLMAGGRIHIDVEPRRGAGPLFFTAAVRVPDHVILYGAPAAGIESWTALFHELGHALHLAHIDPDRPFEDRHLGDSSVSEGFAALWAGILHEPAFARRHLRDEAEAYLEQAALRELWVMRRYAAKLAYELELWSPPHGMIRDAAARYQARLEAATPLPVDQERCWADLGLRFQPARYLRGWLLAAELRARLRADFGECWFESRRAGRHLREIWSYGQQWNAEDLARQLGADGLVIEPLLAEVEILAG